MKDYLAEVDRLEAAISATHPCDARMYGLELCELVRDALKPVESPDSETDDELIGAIDKAMRDMRKDTSWQKAVMDKVTQGSKGVGDWHEQRSTQPPPEHITHVIDRDNDNWWRHDQEDGWTCTGKVDMPPAPGYDDFAPWTSASACGPLVEGRPMASYPHIEYTLRNPPGKGIYAIVDHPSSTVIHRVPDTNRWRAGDWDDYDVKTEGYDTFKDLFNNLEGPFRAYAGALIKGDPTPKLRWEKDEDEDPHETFGAVLAKMPDGSKRMFWRSPHNNWLKVQRLTKPTEWPGGDLISWEDVLAQAEYVEEFRPGVAG